MCRKQRIEQERKDENAKAAKLAESRGWPSLYGSEKQVAWARKIQADIVLTFEKLKQIYADGPEFCGVCDSLITAITDTTSADDIIDVFKDFHATGDSERDGNHLMSIYRRTCPKNDTQKGCFSKHKIPNSKTLKIPNRKLQLFQIKNAEFLSKSGVFGAAGQIRIDHDAVNPCLPVLKVQEILWF